MGLHRVRPDSADLWQGHICDEKCDACQRQRQQGRHRVVHGSAGHQRPRGGEREFPRRRGLRRRPRRARGSLGDDGAAEAGDVGEAAGDARICVGPDWRCPWRRWRWHVHRQRQELEPPEGVGLHPVPADAADLCQGHLRDEERGGQWREPHARRRGALFRGDRPEGRAGHQRDRSARRPRQPWRLLWRRPWRRPWRRRPRSQPSATTWQHNGSGPLRHGQGVQRGEGLGPHRLRGDPKAL
mmetsp:Transcript_43309/g.116426  ORF Transcript_43309/g.116426 Transcript_43309/m.116426 type:complete len:241 (-) Transcript_43309:582-1304(-)